METLTLAMLCALVLVGILRVAPRARETPASSVPRSSSPAGESEHDPLLRYARERFEHLTPREREILALICEGEPSKTIALKLGVSPKTVEFHRSNLLRKTEAGSTAHLVQLATRLGFDLGFPLGENAHQ